LRERDFSNWLRWIAVRQSIESLRREPHGLKIAAEKLSVARA
jgi:hypothetical protein